LGYVFVADSTSLNFNQFDVVGPEPAKFGEITAIAVFKATDFGINGKPATSRVVISIGNPEYTGIISGWSL